ncbi:MAG: molybdopterin molybdotransferase MoeA [Desulfurococcales archaeon]|nr:molybdopterin molybdotransferase MoeA [Desulfurococcales archaeon]
MYEYDLFKYVDLRTVNKLILESTSPLEAEVVDVSDCTGRVLAEDITASYDIPERDISHVDGFAVRVQDIRDVPMKLKVGEGVVREGTAVFVRTGEPVPEHADAVIPVEAVRVEENHVIIYYRPSKGSEIIPRGVDFRAGEVVLRAGHELRPQDVKLLIDLGYDKVRVYRKPKVLVVPTGSEFVEGLRRESSSAFIKGVVSAYGADCHVSEVLPDDPAVIADAVVDGLRVYDVVATIGGASIGQKDYSWRAVKSVGIDGPYFRGIKVVPGRVTSLAIVKRKPVVLLPGFIESAFTALVYVLLPLIRRLSGVPDIVAYRSIATAVVDEDVDLGTFGRKYKSFLKVRFVKLVRRDGLYTAEVTKTVSFMLSPLVKTSGYIEVPPGATGVCAGSSVTVYGVKGVFS